MSRPSKLSLFSGIGLDDLASQWAGIETVCFCEIDEWCQRLLKKHWPHTPIIARVQDVSRERIKEITGRESVDIVAGGFPCQPFSSAGQRKGAGDDRYLWPEMLRVISDIRPTWVLAENVDGILSMAQPISLPHLDRKAVTRTKDEDLYEAVFTQQEIMQLRILREDLAGVGYDSTVYSIPACGLGAWHQRYRVFIVAHSASQQAGITGQPRLDRGMGYSANSDSIRCGGRGFEGQGVHREQARSEVGSGIIADLDGTATARFREHGGKGLPEPEANEFSARVTPNPDSAGLPVVQGRGQDAEFYGHGTPDGSDWWGIEPDVARVVHGGTPGLDRVNRVRGLGNANPPQMYYPFYKAIGLQLLREISGTAGRSRARPGCRILWARNP